MEREQRKTQEYNKRYITFESRILSEEAELPYICESNAAFVKQCKEPNDSCLL